MSWSCGRCGFGAGFVACRSDGQLTADAEGHAVSVGVVAVWLCSIRRTACFTSCIRGLPPIRAIFFPCSHCRQDGGDHSTARRRAHAKEQPRDQKIWIDMFGLHKAGQADADNQVAHHDHSPDTQPVADQTPKRTGDQRQQLVREPECTDRIANPVLLTDDVGHDEADGGVEEDEEGDGEEGDAEEVGRGLEWGDCEAWDEARHDG